MAAMTQAVLINGQSAVASSALSKPMLKAQKPLMVASVRVSSRSVSCRASTRVMAAVVDIEKLVSDVKGLTLEEARVFTDRLQAELGVTAAAIMPVGGGVAAAPAEAAPVVEEKTEFDLFLDEVPTSARIAAIKVVRTLTGLGLKEAKDMIEGLPKQVKAAITKEEAEEAKKQLEGVGAKVSIK
eukprot:TRINITY_DN22259_c0_g1_i1.p2 TRINITY_DN22259_c0_g1~~TRINITY_DN22259_c0_g1_i1.p2  ORF type:complete len:184 (-),score=71.51 TRINITY_DN22259_c0_g1_i1:766-1317(-)